VATPPNTGLLERRGVNYFPGKDAIFVELAVASSERLTNVLLERGFRVLLDELVKEDPD